LLLHLRLGEVAVAQFSAAARLVEPAQIIPASLMAAVFPAFTLALGRSKDEARVLGGRASLLLCTAGVCTMLAILLLAPQLVLLLYGAGYAGSVTILRILGLALLPAFVNYSLTHYLIARRQQSLVGLFTTIMVLLHAAASWWAIAQWGTIGPAISMVVAELFLLGACLFALARVRPQSSASLQNQALAIISRSSPP
jgi:O-antigen/teichoic acid export membrane protein